VRNSADVGVFRGGGVGAGTFEQHQLGAAGVTGSADGIVELAEAGHAGGDDQGLTRSPRFQESCHPSDQYTRGLEAMTNASLQRSRQG